MPLDPNLVPLLQMMEGAPKMHEGTPAAARDAFTTLAVHLADPAFREPVADVQDTTVAGVPVRVYRPEADGPVPTVVFLHGGGFVIGSLDTHDPTCRRLCAQVGAVVVSVDYRLAPEHVFPAAVQDSYAVLEAVAASIGEYGGDASRLAVGGDSAGGNLSAVCAILARDGDGPAIAAQLLVYPAVDLLGDYPSRTENAEGYFLTMADMQWFGSSYLGIEETDPRAAELAADPRLSPLHSDLAGLPPAVVVTAEFDPLRDEGNAYAAALEKAGVPVVHRQFPGLIHGFYGMEQFSPTILEAATWINGQLKDLLG